MSTVWKHLTAIFPNTDCRDVCHTMSAVQEAQACAWAAMLPDSVASMSGDLCHLEQHIVVIDAPLIGGTVDSADRGRPNWSGADAIGERIAREGIDHRRYDTLHAIVAQESYNSLLSGGGQTYARRTPDKWGWSVLVVPSEAKAADYAQKAQNVPVHEWLHQALIYFGLPNIIDHPSLYRDLTGGDYLPENVGTGSYFRFMSDVMQGRVVRKSDGVQLGISADLWALGRPGYAPLP